MSNVEYREVLETKRVEIVKSINLERPFLLDYLRSNQCIDQTDCELVRAETTNEARVGKLIDILLLKGPQAYEHFLDVVQIENPTLYETLTGEKASSKPPRLMPTAFPELKPGVSSQLQPLVQYQQRMLQDLSDGTKRYIDVLRANETLEKKLEKAQKDLECEKEKRKHYENRLNQEMAIDNSLSKNELLLYHEYDELEKGIADRDVYIIVLQMKLLAEKEEVDKLKKMVEELEHKNERIAGELRRVSQNYNQERCQSSKLTECIRIQGDEIQKIDELRKQLRECKYKNIVVTEERDSKIQELMELKKWAVALKTRFDVVEKEKQSSIEKTEVVSNNCVYLQETVRTLSQKLSSAHLELEELRKCNEILTKDCELFKTQRNNALDARREAVISRDEVISEKETIQAQYNDLLAKRDQMNEERAELLKSCDSLHARYKTASEDLIRVKTALNEKEMEVDDLTRELKEANDKNHRNSVLFDNLPGLSDDDDDDDASSGALDNTVEPLKDTADADDESSLRRPWRERRMKSLLNSIKNRIAGERNDDSATREPVSLMAGNVTLDVLQHLLPNLSTRPYNAQEIARSPNISRTLQRQMCLRQRKTECCVQKIRSKTAPCGSELVPDMFPFDYDDDDDDHHLPGVKTTRSTPDLLYPDDINVVPPFFRGRARNMTKKPYRRTKSTQ